MNIEQFEDKYKKSNQLGFDKEATISTGKGCFITVLTDFSGNTIIRKTVNSRFVGETSFNVKAHGDYKLKAYLKNIGKK